MVLREVRTDFDPRPEGPLDRRNVELIGECVRRAQGGDRDAFASLYRAHYPAVARLAGFYLNGRAEDAVAETFVRAWKSLPRYRPSGSPFSAWLYAIARNVVMDELKTLSRTEPRAILPDTAIVDDHADRMAVAAAIKNLPKEQRQVIEMKYLLGMRNPEVAQALRRSVGAINAIQWRALKKMREVLA